MVLTCGQVKGCLGRKLEVRCQLGLDVNLMAQAVVADVRVG